MRTPTLFWAVLLIASLNGLAGDATSTNSPGGFSWPEAECQSRPWGYWWWMGSAVDKTNITREMQRYHDAGMGGVHIIPIYGAKGFESKYIDYLSPQWMEMLRHTVHEGQRLELGVDMTTGAGWCFGGPNVSDADANASLVISNFSVAPGGTMPRRINRENTQALRAFAPSGEDLDLTGRIVADGSVDWRANASGWTVYHLSQKPSGQKVKRAAPGGEGHMLNLLYGDGMGRFLQRFEEAFGAYQGVMPRAMYHDSYEYKSDWGPDFLNQFAKRRGYRLESELPAFAGVGDSNRVARVKCDYRQTVSDIIIEESLPKWVDWSHRHGMITRNEAHGSPGNWLDIYALADIPETEMFYKDRSVLVSKFASSAGHVAGRQLISAETGTWLKEHFTETLADLKYLCDDMFLSGVNHVFYHGICYSPDEAGWPGWVFYASTEMNPRNSIWRDVPALNAYVTRCQSILQSGRPDSDVLLYWPIYDKWQEAGGRMQQFTVHARDWFEGQPISEAAEQLWSGGWSFDYVSDRQLHSAYATNGLVAVPRGAYRTVVVPSCKLMPASTLERLVILAKSGATVIFEGELPGDVPGLGKLEERRQAFKKALESVPLSGGGPLRTASFGKGKVLVGEIDRALESATMRPETLIRHPGLQYVRRAFDEGWYYFIADRNGEPLDDWITLATNPGSVVIMDPLSGRCGAGALRTNSAGQKQIYLQLLPGESIILRALAGPEATGPAWVYRKSAGPGVELTGTWGIKFIAGGPVIPRALETKALASWPEIAGEAGSSFAGTALYALHFNAPQLMATNYLLDLGKVCQSARVRLNDRDCGTLLIAPYRVTVGQLKATDNLLEVEVTSVAANRIRDMDVRGLPWKTFRDINIVNIDYKPFDASKWPLTECGLLGPVTLTPVEEFESSIHDNSK